MSQDELGTSLASSSYRPPLIHTSSPRHSHAHMLQLCSPGGLFRRCGSTKASRRFPAPASGAEGPTASAIAQGGASQPAFGHLQAVPRLAYAALRKWGWQGPRRRAGAVGGFSIWYPNTRLTPTQTNEDLPWPNTRHSLATSGSASAVQRFRFWALGDLCHGMRQRAAVTASWFEVARWKANEEKESTTSDGIDQSIEGCRVRTQVALARFCQTPSTPSKQTPTVFRNSRHAREARSLSEECLVHSTRRHGEIDPFSVDLPGFGCFLLASAYVFPPSVGTRQHHISSPFSWLSSYLLHQSWPPTHESGTNEPPNVAERRRALRSSGWPFQRASATGAQQL